VKVCPSCGRENADNARFCSACGTRLEPEAASREERKVVTCLFCDLVGFTARAESLDPEDVRRVLQPYHARLRSELERFGGTVEKFMGDAVMAVFGAPVAHEDDPERAVRAALAIRDALAEEGELEIRIGITTGEALIALDARPETGEGMASGDVVNTAARLQTAASPGSILVNGTTYRATERAIDYGKSEAVLAKGKATPVPAWEALRARARVGVERVGGAPLVGRERELTLLRETFLRVAREHEPQLLTLVGVPGIGKSRLVFELFQTIESGDLGLVFWRHGRSLPYGDGVTFWALSEMVKAQAGILESDTPNDAGEKLGQAVRRVVTDSDEAGWVERHLRPLAGLETGKTSTGDQRGEAFAAWRRFFEALAETRPLVLVFEDLHWADEALLDFVDYLVEWARGVPLLALCTARPELLARRPGWGGGKVNSSTILLSALSEVEMTELVGSLLEESDLPRDATARLLEHAAGNPLYAEEFTRLLSAGPARPELPETVQGIIAARLDTLPREEKELLQEASVLGRVFWLGALGRERWTLEERLHSLERKEFVSRERRSTVAGETEYVFGHALVRDVAYEQIPKAERAEKHRAVAEWIESLGRPEDHAETLAHHYAAALDYLQQTGQGLDGMGERARFAFRAAGDRASGLNAHVQAAAFYERALALSDEENRAQLLLRYGRALSLVSDERFENVLDQAAKELLAAGDREAAAEAHAFLTETLQQQGERDRAYEHIERAVGLIHDAPASPAKVRVLAEWSRLLVLGGRTQEGIAIARGTYETAQTLELTELAARALITAGTARSRLGDHRGSIEDLERGIDLALSVNSPEAGRGYHNLHVSAWWLGQLGRGVRALEDAVRVAERTGAPRQAWASRASLNWLLYLSAAWDEALRGAESLIADCEAGASMYFEFQPRIVRARILLARAHPEERVLPDLRRAIEIARAVQDPQTLLQTLSHAARVLVELGRVEEARAIAEELVALVTAKPPEAVLLQVLEGFALVAETLGFAGSLRDVLASNEALTDAWRLPFEAVLDQDLVHAAEMFSELGYFDEGFTRLRAAEQLLGEGRRQDADQQLRRALEFFRAVGATRYIRESEALLAAAS